MVTSEAQEIKKQETLVRFSIISYKTRLSVSASKVKQITHDLNHDLFYCTHIQMCVPQYKANV